VKRIGMKFVAAGIAGLLLGMGSVSLASAKGLGKVSETAMLVKPEMREPGS